ncbi:copper chaperone PCu(A)C [Rhizobium lemnae]|uniref:Copper chaperone PCu(A)C n=1 Tax=Rhizobium lemnae TaxID=1214924 RepID=A0ABV8EEF3_9HYPH|nr:copper chaperone PCu(A)C [Rhizobium lemnae]MCJ8508851.1 copper chaperone PCu(A)C [Rhizobium lemnae]
MKQKLISLVAVLLTLVGVTSAFAHGFQIGDLKIGHPYSRAMLPGAKVGGGYLKITNAGADDRLVSASSDRAASVQIHEMKMDGGIMEMRELKDGLAVPANSIVELKPGSYHLMFMNVAEPFKEGEMVKAKLVFEKAGSVDVEFAVGPASGEAKNDHTGHGTGEHKK